MWFLEYLAVNANHRFTVSDLKVENVNQLKARAFSMANLVWELSSSKVFGNKQESKCETAPMEEAKTMSNSVMFHALIC